jgi:putative CocE/NonD family hydrolase
MTNQEATSFRLSGAATNARPGGLTTGSAQDGVSNVLPIPIAGLCTRSANQWTAGVIKLFMPTNPCFKDNKLNDKLGVVFESEPVTSPVSIQGPINARLFASSNSGEGMLSVAVEDVAPDGTVSRLTGGWQVLSHRALDESRTRYLDGKIIQPYHPFTREAQKKLPRGEVAPIDVEVFPTAATIRPGHRLRLAVQAFDVPHLLPSARTALGHLTVMKVHTSQQFPSELTLPTVP